MGLIIIMSTIHITNKGRLMDTLEIFYIFCEAAMTSASEGKRWPFNCFFSPGNRCQSDGARSGE